MLLVSKFPEMVTRIISERAIERNQFIIKLADSVYIAYSVAGGKTEKINESIIVELNGNKCKFLPTLKP